MEDVVTRCARFLEEAAEFVQACGVPKDHAQRVLDHVYKRTPGKIRQEAGGAVNTLMAACDAVNLSLDDCQREEIARCLSGSKKEFAQRNQMKVELVDKPEGVANAKSS